jgi:2-dehydropantoate 2-reductase
MTSPLKQSVIMSSTNVLRICIVGAGAIGSTLAVRLCQAGHHVSMIARGKTLETIQTQGLTLYDQHGVTKAHPHVSDQPEFGVQDYIFVCTKTQDIADVLPTLQPLVGDDTVIMPMNNGVPWWYFYKEGGRFDGQHVKAVDPDGRIATAVDNQRLIGSVLFITAEMTTPGVITSTAPHLIVMGEPSGVMSERLMMIRTALESAGIEARATDRIRDKLWTKIIANISSNPLSVLTHATLEQIYGMPELRDVVQQVMREVLLVAASYGARVEIDPKTFVQLGEAMGPFRTSMLQDLEKGRPLELQAIGDAVLELAAKYDVPMPVTRAVIALARFRGGVRSQ